MLETIQTLCRIPGISGWEDAVREQIRRQAQQYADEILEDANGNLLVFKRGRSRPTKTVMLAAHMDEVGLVVKSATDDGFLKFGFAGGIDRRVVIGKKVFLGEKAIPAVVGLKPIHLTTKEERKTMPSEQDLYLDIGADSKEEALSMVQPGDFGVFEPQALMLGGGTLCQKALDDRVGCGIMLTMLQEDLPIDTWFAFTVQEEIGCRGAFGAAFRLRPEIAIVVEGTTAADAPPAKEQQKICAPGKGPVLVYMDGAACYDRQLYLLLQQVAQERSIPWQTKSKIAGGTDARAIQRTAAGCRVAAVSAAVRYIHSPSSVGSVQDFKHMKTLLMGALEKLEEQNA